MQMITEEPYASLVKQARQNKLEKVLNTTQGFDFKQILDNGNLLTLHEDPRWEKISKNASARLELKLLTYKEPLAKLLDSVLQADQVYRSMKPDIKTEEGKAIFDKIKNADSVNLGKVTQVLDSYGWLGPEEVGQTGSIALFLVLQHAPSSVQEKYLPLLRKAVSEKKAAPSNLAMMEDRVLMSRGEEQLYGTQLYATKEGKRFLWPVRDLGSLDTRRSSLGLPPVSEYLRGFGIEWDLKAYETSLPELKEFIRTLKQ